jgi:hypothetical protein
MTTQTLDQARAAARKAQDKLDELQAAQDAEIARLEAEAAQAQEQRDRALDQAALDFNVTAHLNDLRRDVETYFSTFVDAIRNNEDARQAWTHYRQQIADQWGPIKFYSDHQYRRAQKRYQQATRDAQALNAELNELRSESIRLASVGSYNEARPDLMVLPGRNRRVPPAFLELSDRLAAFNDKVNQMMEPYGAEPREPDLLAPVKVPGNPPIDPRIPYPADLDPRRYSGCLDAAYATQKAMQDEALAQAQVVAIAALGL